MKPHHDESAPPHPDYLEENELPKIPLQLPGGAPQPTQEQPSKNWMFARRSLKYLLLVFTIGVLALSIDELVRMSSIQWGVGLLPFLPVTAAIATTLQLARKLLNRLYPYKSTPLGIHGMLQLNIALFPSFKSKISVRVLGFWLGIIVVEGIKLHTLLLLETPFPRQESGYTTSRQIIDVAISLACSILVFLLTLVDSLCSEME